MGIVVDPTTGQLKETIDEREVALEKAFPNIEAIQLKHGDNLINTPKGQRGAFFSLDPGGAFGTRQAEIERIATQGYKTGSGFDIGFNGSLLGITQQDVANYVLNNYQAQRANTSVGKYGRTNFPKGQRPNAATDQAELTKEVGKRKLATSLDSQIIATTGGAEALKAKIAELRGQGRGLTNTDRQALLTQVTYDSPEEEAQRRKTEGEIKNAATLADNDTTRANALKADQESNAQYRTDKLNLEQRIAHNTNVFNMRNADIAELNANNQTIQLRNADRSAQLDRELRRDLAIFGFEDKAADREYNRARDERQDRQMMILQLMKGLSSLGSNIAI